MYNLCCCIEWRFRGWWLKEVVRILDAKLATLLVKLAGFIQQKNLYTPLLISYQSDRWSIDLCKIVGYICKIVYACSGHTSQSIADLAPTAKSCDDDPYYHSIIMSMERLSLYLPPHIAKFLSHIRANPVNEQQFLRRIRNNFVYFQRASAACVPCDFIVCAAKRDVSLRRRWTNISAIHCHNRGLYSARGPSPAPAYLASFCSLMLHVEVVA